MVVMFSHSSGNEGLACLPMGADALAALTTYYGPDRCEEASSCEAGEGSGAGGARRLGGGWGGGSETGGEWGYGRPHGRQT